MNEKKTQPPTDVSADRPGIDPGSDRLGYALFAKRLAEAIANMAAPCLG